MDTTSKGALRRNRGCLALDYMTPLRGESIVAGLEDARPRQRLSSPGPKRKTSCT